MECCTRLEKLRQRKTRILLLMMGIIATVFLTFQFLTVACNDFQCFISPAVKIQSLRQSNLESGVSEPKVERLSKPSSGVFLNPTDASVVDRVPDNSNATHAVGKAGQANVIREMEPVHVLEMQGDPDEDVDSGDEEEITNEFPVKDIKQDSQVPEEENSQPELKMFADLEINSSIPNAFKPDNRSGPESEKKAETNVAWRDIDSVRDSEAAVRSGQASIVTEKGIAPPPVSSSTNSSVLNATTATTHIGTSNPPSSSTFYGKIPSTEQNSEVLEDTLPIQENPILFDIPKSKQKQMDLELISISKMNHMLNHSNSHETKPFWSSACDREILSARKQVENAPVVKDDPDLHAPLFRNVSRFKRSYELMERILKVYVYKDGEKPMFHTPLLKGIYASEGWFMKQMERNRRFVVKDPRKAHLFYLPFSTRLLEFAFHSRGLVKTDMREYLKKYTETITAKYPFWNRTGGADHFFVACHDWAPYETTPHMARAIRALCNADLYEGFEIGKDVSLPETYVRSPRDPLRDLGGSPVSGRTFLAFFAGNMHGRVRPILLQYWGNKDPSMQIMGRMPRGKKSKMTYLRYMKSSKYCICPAGFEVNSPRVVEAIFFECVPVIISDNFVPPFFEVLDWEAFSIFVPEKDIPRLKDILLSIPEERYIAMQRRVKKVQQHFLWHNTPVKYDIFHMILHSIWFNRLNRIVV